MPMDTEGWVEFSNYSTIEEREEEYAWRHFMDISSVVETFDENAEILFGYSKRILRGEFEIEAIAKDRGFPLHCSSAVEADIKELKEFEEKYGKGEIFGHTTIYYSEITAVKHLFNAPESDWIKLFKLIEKFKEVKRIQDNQIRLVVWFNW